MTSVLATKVWGRMRRRPERRGAVAQGDLHGDGCQPAPLGTDYVDLYQNSSLGRLNTHRRDPGSASAICEGGQDALHRCFDHVRVAVREGTRVAEKNNWTRFVSMQNSSISCIARRNARCFPCARPEGIGVITVESLGTRRLAKNRGIATIVENGVFGKKM